MRGPSTLAAWHERPAEAPVSKKLVVPLLMAPASLARERAMTWGAAGTGAEALFRLVRVLGRQAAREAFREALSAEAAGAADRTATP